MPIAATHLTTASSTSDSTSFSTASVSPPAGALLLLAVHSCKGSTPDIPTVTGLGLTWVRVNGIEYESGAKRVDVFRAMGSPTSGAITISYATTHTACLWSLSQFTEADQSGTNGSGAVVQSGTNSTTSIGALTITLAAFGHPNNAAYGAFVRSLNIPPTVGSGFTSLGSDIEVLPNSAILSEWQNAPDRTVDASQATAASFGGVALEIKGTDPRSTIERYFRTTEVTSDVDAIDTENEATNSATIAQFSAGGTVSSRRFDPGTTLGPSAAVPASPSTAAGMGWRETPAISSERITLNAQTINVTLRVRRSGQTLEVDQNSDVTVILYRVTSTGVHVAELGRATVRFTWTTTATDRVFAIAIPTTEFNASDRIQAEVYVVTLTATTVTPPAVATDLIIQVGATTDSRISPISYFIRYLNSQSVNGIATIAMARQIIASRSFSVNGPSTVTSLRRWTLARAHSASGAGTVDFSRLASYQRASAATGGGVAEFSRRIVASRGFSVAGVAAAAFSRSLVLAKSFSVTGTADAITTRAINYARMFSVAGSFLTRTRIDMPQAVLNRISGGGGPITTVIRKFFPISDD